MQKLLLSARSLSSKFSLFFLGGTIISMLILTMLNNILSSRQMLNIAQQRILAQANATVDLIEAYLAERQTDARIVASLSDTREVIRTHDSGVRKKASSVIQQVRDIYGFPSISVLNEQGVVVMSTDKALQNQDFASRPEVQSALRGTITISEPRREPGYQTLWLYVTAPVYDEKLAIIGVVNIQTSFDRVATMLHHDTNQAGMGSYSVLLDQHLIRIAIPSYPELQFHPAVPLSQEVKQHIINTQQFGSETASFMQQATNLTEIQTSIQNMESNNERTIFFKGKTASTNQMSQSFIQKLEVKNWYYMHRVPETSFYAPVQTQAVYSLLLMIVIAFMTTGAMMAFTRYVLIRPVNGLVAVAKAIAGGDLGCRFTIKRHDEIGILADNFHAMTEALQARIEAEQHAQVEAARLQQKEAENLHQLEQTVEYYLDFVQHVAAGHLNQRLTVHQHGLLGQLGDGLNDMVERLRVMTTHIQHAVDNIATTARDMLANATIQTASISEQSSAIVETTTTVEEVKSIAQQTAQQSGQVVQNSKKALEITRHGTQSVEHTLQGIDQIRLRVQSIAETILSLSNQTQAIGAITTTVSDLADQSSILALNAAIEAARAGEQGKSFAVVSHHVRELAERSKAATVSVQNILGNIQKATNLAVMVTEEGLKDVDQGVKLSGQTGEVIHQIAKEIEQSSQTNIQMVVAAQQQTVGMEQIGKAMYAIQQAVRQSLEHTQQSEHAAKNLQELAQRLQQTIAVYQL